MLPAKRVSLPPGPRDVSADDVRNSTLARGGKSPKVFLPYQTEQQRLKAGKEGETRPSCPIPRTAVPRITGSSRHLAKCWFGLASRPTREDLT